MTEITPHQGDLIYNLTCFDEEGNKIGTASQLTYNCLEDGIEREVQFMERAVQKGAASYATRIMRPQEVRAIVRSRQRQEFWNEVSSRSLGLIGLDIDSLASTLSQMPAMRYAGVENG